MLQRAGDTPYHPSYWLTALGAGGLSISFFMYLMWIVPHAGSPMPTWEHLQAAWLAESANSPTLGILRLVLLIAVPGVALLALLHFLLLAWNIW